MEPRRSKESQPVLAICYDFDKTLSPNDMQAQGYIQAVGYDVEKFWQDATKLANDNAMDSNLAYMYMMVKEAQDVYKRQVIRNIFTLKNQILLILFIHKWAKTIIL